MNIKHTNPSVFNQFGLTVSQIARRAGLSWPAVDQVLNPDKRRGDRVGLDTYLSVLFALRPDWRDITLGELFTIDE